VVKCDRSLTHNPSRFRFYNRLYWECLRIAIPVAPASAFLIWLGAVGKASVVVGPVLAAVIVAPLATIAIEGVLCGAVMVLKWGLLGRVTPGTHPLWSCWCSRWDFLYVAWGEWARPFLSLLEGTFLLQIYLRAMGMKIGRAVALSSGFAQVVDPDMIEIGDYATVSAMYQAHTFEDRVLKIDRIRVRSGASLGAGTVPLYGSDTGELTVVTPHSVIMKHERLLSGARYEGAPCQPAPESIAP
jgi:non-ribosomal peptide synthetase-like protein